MLISIEKFTGLKKILARISYLLLFLCFCIKKIIGYLFFLSTVWKLFFAIKKFIAALNLIWFCFYYMLIIFLCGYGGIGRRVRFRFWWMRIRAGSNPVIRIYFFISGLIVFEKIFLFVLGRIFVFANNFYVITVFWTRKINYSRK